MSLFGYGKTIVNVFQLLGDKENDITRAISYLFSTSRSFLLSFLKHCGVVDADLVFEEISVYYQRHNENGITDIEIAKEGSFYVVIEAKAHYGLPSYEQLKKYAEYLKKKNGSSKYILTMSNISREAAKKELPDTIEGIPVSHIPYSDIMKYAKDSLMDTKGEARIFLKHFISYLSEVIDMKDKHSNIVYVTPIGGESIKEHDVLRQYHCPVGGQGFPKEPPNYIGFRFKGKLQYINFVEKVEYYKEDKLYFRFFLGPDIVPTKKIRAGGKIRSNKYNCDIDLLLTCDTILEAYRKSEERHSE